MGLFDFFKGGSKSREAAPKLPDDLFAAAERGDRATLGRLCQTLRQAVLAGFPKWKTVPEDIRNDPRARDCYCRGLIAVAIAFQEAGDPSLIGLLQGDSDDNPIVAWDRDLAAAQEMIDRSEPARAAELLRAVIARTRGLRGSAVDQNLPRTFGMLGVALYQAGETSEAATVTHRAKVLCEEQGDDEGVKIYAANLQQMGVDPDMASGPQKSTGGRSGDELVMTDAEGRRLTLKDLASANGKVNWKVIGRERVPPAADRLHAQAREAGSAGEYERALTLLAEASRLAPDWPYPLYDAAFTHLLNGDAAAAEAMYERVDALAPRGFFTAKESLDCLRRERDGRLPPGSCLALMSVEWTDDPSEKRRIVEQLLAATPDFPAAWKELVSLTDDVEQKLVAINRGLRCGPDAETEGILRINRALLAAQRGDQKSATRELQKLADDPASTLATEQMAKLSLATIAQGISG